MASELDDRVSVYAALADDVRLRIVDELARSDRSPHELAQWLELPQNLLAHHLGVLSAGGIIERLTSSGDGRRRYVRLLPERLDGIWRPPVHAAEPALFVCSQNSARSQLAAAIWRHRTACPAESAGTHPSERVHRGAVAAARRAGMDLGAAQPRQLRDVKVVPPLVITVCDRAHEEIPGAERWLHWSIPDPAEAGNARAFDAVVKALDQRISRLLGGPTPGSPAEDTP